MTSRSKSRDFLKIHEKRTPTKTGPCTIRAGVTWKWEDSDRLASHSVIRLSFKPKYNVSVTYMYEHWNWKADANFVCFQNFVEIRHAKKFSVCISILNLVTSPINGILEILNLPFFMYVPHDQFHDVFSYSPFFDVRFYKRCWIIFPNIDIEIGQ